MSNPPEPQSRLMTIKQVVAATGISAATIRFYDQQFEEYLGVSRGAGRRRLFSPQAVARLQELRRMLKEQGLSLRQARQALSGGAPAAAAPGETAALRAEVAALKAQVAALEEQVGRLREIQGRTLSLVDGLTGR
ncbi:MAG: MerR family transcriptional regulator [Desulfarculus sp.]|nr:MAG: MerR family transcriptional regulator [Desulfarculus sp.]